MAASTNINPDVLRWVRTRENLSLEQVADLVDLRPSRGKSAVQRLVDWETGVTSPTRKQLSDLADAYRRPLITFFLRKPPRIPPALPDFRTLPDAGAFSLEFAALLRELRARQLEVRDILLDDEDFDPPQFLSTAAISEKPSRVAIRIRKSLGVQIEDQKACKSKQGLFTLIRRSAESIGIFVQLEGDLGSHHSRVDVQEFRGLALVDEIAPFVVVNPSDAPGAQVFTLVHELVHLWLGQTGISNVSPFDCGSEAQKIEAFCNSVTAEILLPRTDLEEVLRHESGLPVRDTVDRLSRLYNVSHTAVAHRLWRVRRITEDNWRDLQKEYMALWEKARRKKKKESSRGPNFYVVRQHRVGRALIGLVSRAVAGGDMTRARAAKILRVPPGGIEKLQQAAS